MEDSIVTQYLCIYSTKLALALCDLYRPNKLEEFTRASNEIKCYLERRGPPLPNILLMGDFNIPQIHKKSRELSRVRKSSQERLEQHRFSGASAMSCA